MSEQPQKVEGRSILGIAILIIVVCAATVAVVYHLNPREAKPRRLWIPAVVDKDTVTILPETRQMNFWTPSVHTREYLSKSQTDSDPDRWQLISNDEPLMQFGMMLHSNANVFGYRRVEIWGHGRSTFKPGWWWTVNVGTNFSALDMGHAYQKFWKCRTPIFIELVENRGSTEP
jgi:hypothetical protein